MALSDRDIVWNLGWIRGISGNTPKYSDFELYFGKGFPQGATTVLFLRSFPNGGTLDSLVEAETITKNSVVSHKKEFQGLLNNYAERSNEPYVIIAGIGYFSILHLMSTTFGTNNIRQFVNPDSQA